MIMNRWITNRWALTLRYCVGVTAALFTLIAAGPFPRTVAAWPVTAWLSSITVVIAASAASAAMAPHFERIRELHMLIDDTELQARLAGRPIDRIEVLPGGRFRVSAGRCSVVATEVSPLANGPPVPGARQFRLEVGALSCS